MPDRTFALRCAHELLRIFLGKREVHDTVAFAWLENHDPPLVWRVDMLVPLVTDDGLRVATKLVDAFMEETNE